VTLRRYLPPVFDLLAGLLAIVLVLAICIGWHAGEDFRAIFALTGAAFFLAGFARGPEVPGRGVTKTLRLSAGGLLGIAAIVLNNGLHLYPILIALFLSGWIASAAGLACRAHLSANPLRAAALALLCALGFAAGSLAVVPRLVAFSTFERPKSSPSFTLTVDGQPVPSSQLRGRVVVLAYWATWCAECRRELPSIESLAGQFRSNPQVAIYAVDLGWGSETAEKGHQFLARRYPGLSMAFDPGPAAEALGVDAIPAVVVLGKDARPRFIHRGFDRSENLEQELARRIDALLQEQ